MSAHEATQQPRAAQAGGVPPTSLPAAVHRRCCFSSIWSRSIEILEFIIHFSLMQESGEEVTPSAAAEAAVVERLPSFSLVFNDLFSVEKGPVNCRSNCLNTSSSSV